MKNNTTPFEHKEAVEHFIFLPKKDEKGSVRVVKCLSMFCIYYDEKWHKLQAYDRKKNGEVYEKEDCPLCNSELGELLYS